MQAQLKKTACAVTLALSLGAAQAGGFSQAWFFGDSLSDTGAFSTVGNLDPSSRWTINNAPLAVNVLASRLGLSANAVNPLTGYNLSGNNYAQGGAQSVQPQQSNKGPFSVLSPLYGSNINIANLPAQVDAYLVRSGGKANPNAFYFVWAGGNDIPAAASSPTTAQTSIATAAGSLAQQVGRLSAAGAGLIMAPNLPAFGDTPALMSGVIGAIAAKSAGYDPLTMQEDSPQGIAAAKISLQLRNAVWPALSLEKTPTTATQEAAVGQALKNLSTALAGASSGPAFDAMLKSITEEYNNAKASLNTLTAFFNSSVDAGIAQSGVNVIRPNVAGLFAAVLANPAAFGINNTTGSACIPSASALTCTLGAQTPGAAQGINYLFADDRHPSPLTHQALGDYFATIVQAPALADALGQVPLSARRIVRETLSAHARALDAAPRAVGTVGALASAGFGRDNIAEGEIKPEAIATLGFDYQATPELALGVAFSGGKVKSDIGAIGSYDGDYRSLSALANFRQGPLWLDGDVFLGNTDIDTRRDVKLGPVYHETQTGSTRAIQMGFALEGGYRMQLGVVNTGPQVGLRYEHIKVGALIEDNLDFSAMRFGDQKIKSLVGSLGWGIEAPLGRATPYASISYNHEFKGDARDISAGLLTTSGNFVTQSLALPDNWTDLSAGVSVALAKNITGFVQINGTAGRDDGNAWGGNLGLNMNF
ncbi:autotransporter domain-containing protein [Aquitalea sp. S1-19]|nr:autotransporter domain-containing protein [Aquitalea sp. S1-19]